MAYNEKLAGRVREKLAHTKEVKEKKMFGGLAFMVDGKMCITVGEDRIMCRINPSMHEEAIQNEGVQTVKMQGRDYIGYIHINEQVLKSTRDFNHWIELALEFNPFAKTSKKN